MKRFFIFLLIVGLLYSAKPYWEKPISNYIDLDFLTPVDDSIDQLMASEPFVKTVHFVNDAIKKVTDLVTGEEPSTKPVEQEARQQAPAPSIDPTTITMQQVTMGMSKETVESALGKAIDQSLNEYGLMWHTYHKQYKEFIMIAYDEKETVQALYTNDDQIEIDQDIGLDSAKKEVREQFGEPLTQIKRGLNIYMLNQDQNFDVFKVEGAYLYVFYDVHRDHTVTAIQLVAAQVEEQKQAVYAPSSEALQQGFEQQLFHLTNASRVRHGLSPLQQHQPAAGTAYKHSVDMAVENYFSHQNLEGLSPFDRLQQDQVTFQSAGENLAYGQTSSIFAHEGLMNSEGHRENILQDAYTHLGIGVAFNQEQQPYYTQLFLRPT